MQINLKKFHKQKGPNHCWYACFLMVHDTVNNVESDYERKKKDITSVTDAYFNSVPSIDPYRDGIDDFGVEALLQNHIGINGYCRVPMKPDGSNKGEILDGIRHSLGLGHPAVVGMKRPGGAGHYCVIVGIDNNGLLIIVDPLGDGTPVTKAIDANMESFFYDSTP